MSTRPIHQFMFLSATLVATCFAGCSASRFGHKTSCSSSCAQNNCGCTQHANPVVVPENKPVKIISPDVAPPSPVPAATPSKAPAAKPPVAKPPVAHPPVTKPKTTKPPAAKPPIKSALIDDRFTKSPGKRKILREATNRPKFPTLNNNSNFNKFDNFPYAEPRTSLPPIPEVENDQNLSHGDMPGTLWKPLQGFSDNNDFTYAPKDKVMEEHEVELWPYQINNQPVLQSQKRVLGIRKISSEVHANRPIMIIPSVIN